MFLRVGAKGLRLTMAAVGTFMLPGVDPQVAAFKKIIAARKASLPAVRTLAEDASVAWHKDRFP